MIELPEWIDRQTWADFEEMRRSIKKPMTDRARRIAVKRLAEFREAGFTSEEVLEHCILNCYQGVFAPRVDQRSARNGAVLAEINVGSGPTIESEELRMRISEKANRKVFVS